MDPNLFQLAENYRSAGNEIHDAIRDMVAKAGGFVNASNNKQEKSDMNVMVYNGKNSEEHWMPLKVSNVLFFQTILSIAGNIDQYL